MVLASAILSLMKLEISSPPHASSRHCVAVWIDHEQARICHFASDVMGAAPPYSIHCGPVRAINEARDRPEAAKLFFAEVSRSLGDTARILIMGPSSAKHEFLRYLQRHDHSVELRIAGVETLDRPSDGQLVALANKHFAAR
jgi:stalled ribosome rescue protein Dom34